MSVTVGRMIFQYSDDVVVILSTIDHSKPADRNGTQEDVPVTDRPFRENADVHRIAVADKCVNTGAVPTYLRHALTAQGPGEQAIQRWTHAGILLRPIY